jgi:hypothetical protein
MKNSNVRFTKPSFSFVLFPLNDAEYWTIVYFEEHVQSCKLCRVPYHQLCRVGLCHARAIDSYMYYKNNYIISATSRKIYLDVPKHFCVVTTLLKTIQDTIPTEIGTRGLDLRPR